MKLCLLCFCMALFTFADGKGTIPSDYTLYSNAAYYKFHDANETWFEAKKICANETLNGTLAFPSTTVQYSALSDLMNDDNANDIWLGISALDMGNTFITDTGIDANTLTPLQWSYMQPDNFGGAYGCVELDSSVRGLILRDCQSPHQFACQVNSGPRFDPPCWFILVAVALACRGWII